MENIKSINVRRKKKSSTHITSPHPHIYSARRSDNNLQIHNETEPEEKSKPNKNPKSKCIIISIVISGIVFAIGIVLLYFLVFKNKNKNNAPQNGEEEKKDSNIKSEETPIITSKEEVMKIFQPKFKVSSKVDTLNQLLFKSRKKYNMTANGIESSHAFFTKAKYDIFTLNEKPSGVDKDFYTAKYSTAITINSYCIKLSSGSEEDDCELETYLDLNIRDTRNLRRNDEINEEEILKEAILPICLIEHTDTNLILSVTCPETLSSNFKKDIIEAFEVIKPDSIHQLNETEEYMGTKIEKKDNKIFIETYNKDCDDYNENDYLENPNQKMDCLLTKNIITDNEGNLISSKTKSTTEITIDDLNKNSNEQTLIFEDVTEQNKNSLNKQNYKINLDILFDKIKSFMNKEEYLTDGGFQQIVNDLINVKNDGLNTQSNIRYLREEAKMEELGIKAEKFFARNVYGIPVDLNIKNDVGLGESVSAKLSSYYNDPNITDYTISLAQKDTKINETLTEFMILVKSGNKLAKDLYSQLNDKLLNIRDIIDSNITELNNNLAFKDLSSIFDGTFTIDELQMLQYKFIAASQNLNNNLDNLKKDIPYVVSDMKNQLKNYINNFLGESHNLLYKVFNKLNDVTNLLSSEKSRIVEIATYYLNNTNTPYYEIIEKAKNILDNYYKEEISLIKPLVDSNLIEFSEEASKSIKDIQYKLNKIMDRIDNGETTINLASTEDYRNVIKYLYNSEIYTKEIITNVEDQFKEAMNIKSNGYLETSTEINNNKNTYEKISQRAIDISYSLDNNKLIDTTFDTIMTYFREQFVVIFNYMDRLRDERFSLRENVLSDSLFDTNYINEIDNFLLNEKKIIYDFIIDENNEYLSSMNTLLNTFKSENGQNLESLMNNLDNELSINNISSLNNTFNDVLNKIFDNINSIIAYNYQKAEQYLNNVKNSGSTHCTNAFISKYNAFKNSFDKIKTYINSNLKIILANKYKNVINQIRLLLQSIKSNKVLKKYYNELPFAEEHILNIDRLFNRFEEYISDEIFNNNFAKKISGFIQTANNILNQYENNLYNLYYPVSRLSRSGNTNYDYYHNQPICSRYCCGKIFRHCYRHCTSCANNYVGYHVTGTNNHLELKTITLDSDTEFDNNYKQIYNNFANIISLYNNHLEEINNKIELKIQEILNRDRNTNYLNSLNEKIKNIINNKLGNNLLVSSYNYYKNLLSSTLPTTLNDILEEIKSTSDKVYEKINLNKNKFKSTIYEFKAVLDIYYKLMLNNITFNYGDSIIEKSENEFNYTIKYYYNLIASKVNKTYSYLLNSIPINAKPFDEISNIRITEIKNSYNDLINQINESKNVTLQKKNQIKILNVNSENFFDANDYINNNIDDVEEQLQMKIDQLDDIAQQVQNDDPSELIAAKYYLENALFGKQIKDIYENVDKVFFMDLQYNAYEQLIKNNWKQDNAEFINKFQQYIINSGEIINNKFKFEKEKYVEMLNNVIYKKLYNPEELKSEIRNLYSSGLKPLDENDKNMIYSYLKDILNVIKNHLLSESSKIGDILNLNSYSNNFEIINNTIKNFKDSIYSQFNDTITSVINDFFNNVTKIFYTDYLEHYLEEYQNKTLKEKFPSHQFLNTSINLTDVININLKKCVDQYKNLAKEQINFLYKNYYQQLDNIFTFLDLKNKINDEIESVYSSHLFSILKNKANSESGNLGVKDYNLNETSIEAINQIIKDKISQTKIIVEKMKGNGYNLIIEKEKPDFSDLKRNTFKNIETSFNNFVVMNDESKTINDTLTNNIFNNFKAIINDFVPSFGVDFFDRILKYNEIEKIRGLFYDLKYSLLQTVTYHITLCYWYEQINLPEDIKIKILTFNNIDTIIKSKKEYIISLLNQKLDTFFEDTKNLTINLYINNMITDPNIKIKFSDNIVSLINATILGYRFKLENEYNIQMNNYIREPFIKEYQKIINKESNEMYIYIEKRKEEVRVDLNEIFTLNSDTVLSQINSKLNETVKAIEEYTAHFSTFEISKEVSSYLFYFGKNIIFPIFQNIEEIINKNTMETIFAQLDQLSEEFINEYSVNNYESKINNAKNYFIDYIMAMNNTLKHDYGAIENVYSEKLEAEISNNKRIRRLEETNEEKIIYNQNVADVKLEDTFQELQNSSNSILEYFDGLNLFMNFNEKLEQYIYEINYQNNYTQLLLNRNKNNNNHFDEMMERLNELNSHSLDYYDKVNISYNKVRELINKEIKEIDMLIKACIDVTFNVMADKFIKINNTFNKIDEKSNENTDELELKDVISLKQDKDYNIKTQFKNYLVEYEFLLDIYFEESDIKKPRLKGKVVNTIHPKNFEIDIYTNTSQKNGKIGTKIKPYFNNIVAYSDINYDSNINVAIIDTYFNFQEYKIEIQHYQDIEEKKNGNVGGIIMPITGRPRSTTVGGALNETISSVNKKIQEVYN